jgi:NADH dehydrogenase FAD-containing subunit
MAQARSKIFLVGGGHAHLYSLKKLKKLYNLGADVTVIGPSEWHYYSGMGPGILSHIYLPAQARFNIKYYAEKSRATFIAGNVKGISPVTQKLYLENGTTFNYDLVSFNVGSFVPTAIVSNFDNNIFTVKPVENIEKFQQYVIASCSKKRPIFLVIGGGPTGVELAGNLWRLLKDSHCKANIKLLTAGPKLLERLPQKASEIAKRSLTKRGVEIITNFKVGHFEKNKAHSKNGKHFNFDGVILSTGIKPTAIFSPDLPTSKDGSLIVNKYLASTKYPNIMGGGDCIHFSPTPLDKVGVYAVRQGPILFNNIKAFIKGNSPINFVPQKKYTSILNMGDNNGLLIRDNFVTFGPLNWMYKELLDKTFVKKYQKGP